MQGKSIAGLKKFLRKKWDKGEIRGQHVPDDWTFQDFWDYIKFDAIVEKKKIGIEELKRNAHSLVDQEKKEENKQKALKAVLEPSYNKFADAFTKVAPLIVKVHERMLKKKEEEKRERQRIEKLDSDSLDILLNIGNFAILKKDSKLEAPKPNQFNAEESDLVKTLKGILRQKLKEIKALLIKYPYVPKESNYVTEGLNRLNQLIKDQEYKSAILLCEQLFTAIQKIVEEEEGKTRLMDLTKAEGEARNHIISNMDTLVERLHMEESILLGKEEYFSEKEDKKEQAEKRRIERGTYVKKPKPGKASKPKKFVQYGISKPEVDLEDRSMLVSHPIEYEDEVKAREEEEKKKDQLTPLKEAFEDLTPEEKGELLRSLLKRKMKEVDS